MSIPDELRNIRDHLRSGRWGQREVWERQLERAAAERELLRESGQVFQQEAGRLCAERNEARAEVERLRAENYSLREALKPNGRD